jgi:hypothetical protein
MDTHAGTHMHARMHAHAYTHAHALKAVASAWVQESKELFGGNREVDGSMEGQKSVRRRVGWLCIPAPAAISKCVAERIARAASLNCGACVPWVQGREGEGWISEKADHRDRICASIGSTDLL